MSDCAVVGGTGTVGRLIVAELQAAGVTARVLSRHSSDRPVDLASGEGLTEGLSGCSVVIDASNGSPRHPEPVIVDGCRRLMHAAAAAGVSRVVCVSIVGIEHVATRYYRAKLAQERIVLDSALSSTIVRSTQFHELLEMGFGALARLRLSPRSGARLQPVAAQEAARVVADAARRPEPGEWVHVAGPDVADVTELARVWQRQRGGRLIPTPLPLPPRLGRALREGALTCAQPDFRGETSFESWCAQN